MPLLDRQDVLAYLSAEDEIPGALRWLEHHKLRHDWDWDALTLTVHLSGPSADPDVVEAYLLKGFFDDYRALPPVWTFVDPRDASDAGRAAYPAPGPFEGGSILHPNGVICAPWSRLAYQSEGGPHSDWTDIASWQTTATDRTRALTIPDMLGRIRAEVLVSADRLAPLELSQSAA